MPNRPPNPKMVKPHTSGVSGSYPSQSSNTFVNMDAIKNVVKTAAAPPNMNESKMPKAPPSHSWRSVVGFDFLAL